MSEITIHRLGFYSNHVETYNRLPRKMKKRSRRLGLSPGRKIFPTLDGKFLKDLWNDCQVCGHQLNLEFICKTCEPDRAVSMARSSLRK